MTPSVAPPIHYPDGDGQPLSDNTLQFRTIVTVQGNLDLLFRGRPDVFVAGDLLWYPVEGDPTVRQAPDVLVAFGRPKGDRGSYKQWEEGAIPPQVVFEVLSPGNRRAEMARKFAFYDRYGVDEYYVLDPDRGHAEGYMRQADGLTDIPSLDGWVSPRLGVRFAVGPDGPALAYPDGRPFLSFVELGELAEQADRERKRADRLAAKLRELGVDPDAV